MLAPRESGCVMEMVDYPRPSSPCQTKNDNDTVAASELLIDTKLLGREERVKDLVADLGGHA